MCENILGRKDNSCDLSEMMNQVKSLGIKKKARSNKKGLDCEIMINRLSAYEGCLGNKRRRRTWKSAKSCVELTTSVETQMSEWGNPAAKAAIFN